MACAVFYGYKNLLLGMIKLFGLIFRLAGEIYSELFEDTLVNP